MSALVILICTLAWCSAILAAVASVTIFRIAGDKPLVGAAYPGFQLIIFNSQLAWSWTFYGPEMNGAPRAACYASQFLNTLGGVGFFSATLAYFIDDSIRRTWYPARVRILLAFGLPFAAALGTTLPQLVDPTSWRDTTDSNCYIGERRGDRWQQLTLAIGLPILLDSLLTITLFILVCVRIARTNLRVVEATGNFTDDPAQGLSDGSGEPKSACAGWFRNRMKTVAISKNAFMKLAAMGCATGAFGAFYGGLAIQGGIEIARGVRVQVVKGGGVSAYNILHPLTGWFYFGIMASIPEVRHAMLLRKPQSSSMAKSDVHLSRPGLGATPLSSNRMSEGSLPRTSASNANVGVRDPARQAQGSLRRSQVPQGSSPVAQAVSLTRPVRSMEAT
ncbi:hypothetical protein M427DRAFT_493416 [Gonapodya prolifera JEL478]|uniref:G-protein coupled receptors family 2 profile 2 domain-containing protein n=1 Tax=Gonapodya prolifera (strain JEL478) TaxID=1344416 RepID=A0A139AJN3_GONPJ|nr:hypothetical protein M427DRAFT_493416 [Gonapodya prolifera JEL478]|eukprot:KXS16992.1 hypothetical protein M427DRAFT_493416 [Gonapodya prolifera JEL478]